MPLKKDLQAALARAEAAETKLRQATQFSSDAVDQLNALNTLMTSAQSDPTVISSPDWSDAMGATSALVGRRAPL